MYKVLIEDNIPKKCTDCRLCKILDTPYAFCMVASNGVPSRYKLYNLEDRPEWCPIETPERTMI